jgi:hypothetical protein
MAEHGIDGAFLQRFAEQCQPGQENSIRKLRDEVGQLVREAAEKEGRVFAIMYVFIKSLLKISYESAFFS